MTAEAFSASPDGGQSYLERPPGPALRGLVSSVWVQRVGLAAAPYVHRRIPNGTAEFVCQVGSAPRVIGPLTEPLVEVLDPGATVIGMRFVPGAFAAVSGKPASEVVGLAVEAQELWGRSAAALGEVIGSSASPEKALTAMQLYMRERAGAPPDGLVSEAVRGLMPWRMSEVTSLSTALHISETQLRRRFRTAVGHSPKTLHRMLRFQGFLALVQQAIARSRTPTDDRLGLLAVRAGYADQPHLTRECVRFTGVPPRVFLAQTQQTCACGHEHAVSFAPMLRAETERRLTFGNRFK